MREETEDQALREQINKNIQNNRRFLRGCDLSSAYQGAFLVASASYILIDKYLPALLYVLFALLLFVQSTRHRRLATDRIRKSIENLNQLDDLDIVLLKADRLLTAHRLTSDPYRATSLHYQALELFRDFYERHGDTEAAANVSAEMQRLPATVLELEDDLPRA